MTVKEFKQHTNAKVQVLIPSDDIYMMYTTAALKNAIYMLTMRHVIIKS